jgi:hypothetical protein
MIIDLILSRKDGRMDKYPSVYKDGKILMTTEYNPQGFYNQVMTYYRSFPNIVEPIATALDAGTEQQVKKELSDYIVEQDYNHNIIKYINSVKWL